MSKVKAVSEKLGLLYSSEKLLWLIVCVGILLRASQFLYDRSLWMDEAMLAQNILSRTFQELLQPLDYNQAAPIGFLLVERALVQTLGTSEYVLRLFPLLSGILALLLFCWVAASYIAPRAIPIALGLFAISNKLIYYSSEAKQYSSDVAIALLIYVVGMPFLSGKPTVPRTVIFAAVGATAVWFSHPVAFVLAGVGVTLTLLSLCSKDWTKVAILVLVCSVWLSSFGALYILSLRDISHNDHLLNFWDGLQAFVPFPPRSVSDFYWFMEKFIQVFQRPSGFFPPGVAAFAFLTGCFLMLRDRKKDALLVISPIPFALLASGLRLYPFTDRFLLFAVPLLVLAIAEGAERVRASTPVGGIILIGLLLAHPALSAGYHLISPRTVEEIKPALAHASHDWQAGDLLYVYHGSWPAFVYYAKSYDLAEDDYVAGVDSPSNWSDYAEDLSKLRGNGRVWILFSHDEHFPGEKQLFLANLDSLGTRLESFIAPGASVYLYDLSKTPSLE